MNNLIKKWYFVLIVTPVIGNIISHLIKLPGFFSNWLYTIIASQFLLIVILSYELNNIKRSKSERSFIRDKAILKSLLSILDPDDFQVEVADVHSWNGYKRQSIHNIIDFAHESQRVSLQPVDRKLRKLIEDLSKSLKEFIRVSSVNLYGDHKDWLTPAKYPDYNLKKAEIACPLMDSLTQTSFQKLKALMEYSSKNGYLDTDFRIKSEG